jgi:hypothetical protein
VVTCCLRLDRSQLAGSGPGIGRLPAQRLARRELAKGKYARPFTARISADIDTWLSRLFSHLGLHGLVLNGWVGIIALAVLLALAVGIVLFLIGPTRRNRRLRSAGLLEGGQLSAADHRRLAAELAASGNCSAAVIERVRAIAAELDARGVLLPRPGRTATELAAEAGTALPGLSAGLRDAAELFGRVRYGDVVATRSDYELTERLDTAVREARIAAEAQPAGATR